MQGRSGWYGRGNACSEIFLPCVRLFPTIIPIPRNVSQSLTNNSRRQPALTNLQSRGSLLSVTPEHAEEFSFISPAKLRLFLFVCVCLPPQYGVNPLQARSRSFHSVFRELGRQSNPRMHKEVNPCGSQFY